MRGGNEMSVSKIQKEINKTKERQHIIRALCERAIAQHRNVCKFYNQSAYPLVWYDYKYVFENKSLRELRAIVRRNAILDKLTLALI